MNNSFNAFCERKDMQCNHVCIQIDDIYNEKNNYNHMNTSNSTSNYTSSYFSYSLPAPSLASKPSSTSMIIQDIKDTYTSISSLWS